MEESVCMNPTSYLEVFNATPYERVQLIKAGLTARDAMRILSDLMANSNAVFAAIGVSKAAIARRAAQGRQLPSAQSELIIGLARLVGQVEDLVGDVDDFSASAWLGAWLMHPLPALGGQRPGDFIDTTEGQRVVSDLLAQVRSGAYA